MTLPEFSTWTDKSSPAGIELPAGIKVRWVCDETYETRGSYALNTPEETDAAEVWELERLADGRLVVLGCIVEDDSGEQYDSLWGIVIEPSDEKLVEFFGWSMELPDEMEVAVEQHARAFRAWREATKRLEAAEKKKIMAELRQHFDPPMAEDLVEQTADALVAQKER